MGDRVRIVLVLVDVQDGEAVINPDGAAVVTDVIEGPKPKDEAADHLEVEARANNRQPLKLENVYHHSLAGALELKVIKPFGLQLRLAPAR